MTQKRDWGIVSGAWGDVICQLGFVQNLGLRNVLYFGVHNPEMIEFLKCQKFIENLEFTHHNDANHFISLNSLVMRRATFERGMASILKDKPFSPQLFEPTSALMDFNNAKLEDIPIAKNLTLPQECYEWANRMASQLSDDFFIVQPYSINSTTKEAHWPHWHELIQWISGDFSQDYVLAGNNWDSHLYQGMGHVKNMVNHFPTVCHLYALAEKSKGVITTSNSLAHWCVSQNVPVTVIANIVSSEPNYFFRKVIHGDCVIYFTYYSPFQRVVFSLNERWGIWPAEAMQ